MSDLREAIRKLADKAERDLRDVGGWDNQFCGIPAGGVRSLVENMRAALAEPAQEMTDERIMDLGREMFTSVRWPSTALEFARAVIAADRASRLPEITEAEIVSALEAAGVDLAYGNFERDIAVARAVEALVRGKT